MNKPVVTQYEGQKEFLRNGVGTEYKTAGATLKASAFPANAYVKAGTAVFKDADGFYKPVLAATPDTMTGAGLTSHDVKINGANVIVGVLVAGHPREDRCTGVTAAFKTATKGRLVFDV